MTQSNSNRSLGCDTLETTLLTRHGEVQRSRIACGLKQVRNFWLPTDGDAAQLEAFVTAQFVPEGPGLDGLFQRLEFVLESVYGHLHEIGRDLRWFSDLEAGAMLPVDSVLSSYDVGAHFIDDAFANKLAFIVLLNFPLSTLEQRLQDGGNWSPRQWAQARLTDLFAKRIPAAVKQAMAEAAGQADRYVASYNIWAHHLLDEQGQRLFEPGKRLLSHWNLRDELKSRYAQGGAGLEHQRMIQQVMERIVTQTIPAVVIDSPWLDWKPFGNSVTLSTSHDAPGAPPADLTPCSGPEPDTRYQVLLDCYHAARQADPYSPTAPTHMARSFDEGRQIPEARVIQMLEDVCASPLVQQVGALIASRLGRPLEPFDIWYSGFRPGSALDESELDAITRSRYPDAVAYKAAMPDMLEKLGFSTQRAQWLASRIEVDPARGSGHAMGAAHKRDNARLRTRIGAQGMDYKGFNIAVHEMGHNVEQTFSLNGAQHWLLNGVPNTAFTEAMAFVFQARDLALLDQSPPDASALAEAALNDFWMTFEIAGVGLVDAAVWCWMDTHPDANAAQLKEAVLHIAKEVWNRFYAPCFGQRDCVLLGIYSHMVHSFLYLPDYAIGRMIACQVEQQITKTGQLGTEVERMCCIGRLTPDLWMEQATGRKLGPQALLCAAAAALDVVRH